MGSLASSSVASRPCACNCGTWFTPVDYRPGQQYIRGHKPLHLRAKPSKTTKAPASASEENVVFELTTQARNNYRFAIESAQAESKQFEQQIDAIDNDLESYRNQVAFLQQKITEAQDRKERIEARHLTCQAVIEALLAMYEGTVPEALLAS